MLPKVTQVGSVGPEDPTGTAQAPGAQTRSLSSTFTRSPGQLARAGARRGAAAHAHYQSQCANSLRKLRRTDRGPQRLQPPGPIVGSRRLRRRRGGGAVRGGGGCRRARAAGRRQARGDERRAPGEGAAPGDRLQPRRAPRPRPAPPPLPRAEAAARAGAALIALGPGTQPARSRDNLAPGGMTIRPNGTTSLPEE